MGIRIKIAKSAKELHDVYKLRYQVYVQGKGFFKNWPTTSIVDPFDGIPNMANIIAYDEISQEPVGTFRLNIDSEMGLPSDELFDFGPYRQQVNDDRELNNQPPALFVSAGMLAIAEPWRNRRDVFLAMFKMSAGIGHSWDCTHVVATVNADTISIYRRLGFKTLSDKIWVPSIGEYIYAVCLEFSVFYQWAFGNFTDKHELIDRFSGCFEYLLLDAGSHIFAEETYGTEAYLISKGTVKITKKDGYSDEMFTLATLDRGHLFGELSLIDEQVRSASAWAVTNTELIVLNKDLFWNKIEDDPLYLNILLNLLCDRLRDIDERAFLYAHGTTEAKLRFFINKVRQQSTAAKKEPLRKVAKITVKELAYMSSVSVERTQQYLNELQQNKKIEVTASNIKFYCDEII
jgi:CRP-like cAMP-binding protein